MAFPSNVTIFSHDTQCSDWPIGDQKIDAVEDQQGFEAEIGKIQAIALTSAQSDFKQKTVLCRHAVAGNHCVRKNTCRFAHTIATYTALNLLESPSFKEVSCENLPCRDEENCKKIHPGDLAQQRIPRGERKWFIAGDEEPERAGSLSEYDTQYDNWSIEQQKIDAVTNQQGFEAEIKKIQKMVKASGQKDTKYKTTLCKAAVRGQICNQGSRCWFAHRMATYVAKNLLTRPNLFKSKPCSRGVPCSYGKSCRMFHPGDLAQQPLRLPATGRIWFIAPPVKRERLTFIEMHVGINVNVNMPGPLEMPPPPYRSPKSTEKPQDLEDSDPLGILSHLGI